MKPTCPTHFPACLLCYRLDSLGLWLSLYVILACPAEMLPIRFKSERLCPSQVGYVYNRPVFFQVNLVSVDGLSGGGVLALNQDRTASSSRQDIYSIGQDRKCN